MNQTPNVIYLGASNTNPQLNDLTYTSIGSSFSPNSIVGLFVIGTFIWKACFGG